MMQSRSVKNDHRPTESKPVAIYGFLLGTRNSPGICQLFGLYDTECHKKDGISSCWMSTGYKWSTHGVLLAARRTIFAILFGHWKRRRKGWLCCCRIESKRLSRDFSVQQSVKTGCCVDYSVGSGAFVDQFAHLFRNYADARLTGLLAWQGKTITARENNRTTLASFASTPHHSYSQPLHFSYSC